MVRYIAGDVGGTNTRLILVEVGPNGQESKGITKRYASSDFKSLDDVVALFIKDVGLSLGKVDALCVAVAGPVTRGADDVTCNFTNLVRLSFHLIFLFR
jgi:glucokinase